MFLQVTVHSVLRLKNLSVRLVCHVQFPAQGAGFCLQFPNVPDKRALYKGAASQ